MDALIKISQAYTRIYLLSLLAFISACSQETFEPGIDYNVIEPPLSIAQVNNEDGKVSVIEIFWYGCPSCYEFEPHLEQWLYENESKISFTSEPAPFGSWAAHAQLFWALKSIGIEKDARHLIFNSIHEQRNPLVDPNVMASFIEENFGVDPKAFFLSYNSQNTKNNMENTFQVLRQARLRSVPAFIINGKYVILENDNQERMLRIADYLIDIES